MYFKKMSLHGFKSFADPVTIEFDKGITCVVGPNGSGKSNISDALRWVLGEQSPKMLRGGKMDEVIFAGTDKRKSRGMAEVTLVMDNSDGNLPIDFAEVSITRRMYRSGESEYYINNTQCRLRDIRELIMDTGIGVDGYSLIGQGKIAEIISGKPESRRQIFEEAAGIVKYRSKKAETERKLESTTHNLERVNDIVTELEDRIEPLRIDSEKAAKYLDLSSRYKENEINVTLKNIEQNEIQSVELQNDIDAASVVISGYEEQRAKLESEIREKKDRVEEIDREDFEERDRIMKFTSEMNELRSKVALGREKINTLESNIKAYGEEKQILAEKLEKEENNKRELETRLKTLSQNSQNIESDLETVTNELKDAEKEAAENDIKFNRERDQIYELSMKSSSKGAEIAGLIQMGASLNQRLEAVKDVSVDDEDFAAKASLEAG
ncbi:MAG: AAA family ATPase, partial [Firmicutes bacterium]|nr:AAA family ATPase [Bacillota bacterium]